MPIPANIGAVRELLEGRRFGFAPRPLFGHIAIGLGVAITLLDLMAWFGWGVRDTNGFVVAAWWLAIATVVIAALAAFMSLVESSDAADADRPLARLDLIAAFGATLLYLITAGLRSQDLGGAGAAPLDVLSAAAGLIVLAVDGVIGATLYASREWEVPDEDEYEPRRHHRDRVARARS